MLVTKSPYFQLLKEADELKLRGEHEAAIKVCQDILCDDLNCVEAYEEIGDNYMNMRQYDKAVLALNKAIKLNPETANGHYLLGFSYSAINEWDKSTEYLERANKLEPNHPEILRCLGWTLFHAGKQAQGIIILNRAINMAPDDTFILTDLGMCQLSNRNFEEAEATFQKILSIEPHNNKALECLEACKYFKNRSAKQ